MSISNSLKGVLWVLHSQPAKAHKGIVNRTRCSFRGPMSRIHSRKMIHLQAGQGMRSDLQDWRLHYGFLAGIQGHPRGFQGSRYSLLVVYRGPRTSRYVHHGGPVQGSDPIRSYIGIRHVTAKNGDTYGAGIEHITHSRLRQHQGCTLYLHGQLSSGHWFSLKGIRNTAGPYIAHLESQYSWAQIRLAAYILGSRPSAQVPRR